jgi:diaminopimelate epimerase
MEFSLLIGLDFVKMSGTGNDFIMLDNRVHRIPLPELQKLAKRICPRGTAVGADGLIALKAPPGSGLDFAWDFINADGSVAEMCGNGARCAARLARDIGLAGDNMVFSTLAGPIHAAILDNNRVKVGLTPPTGYYSGLALEAVGEKFNLAGVNTGVPHTVMECDNLDAVPVKLWGQALRRHQHFAPAGANVNFTCKLDQHTIRVRTYERGVEDETLACGTGATAAALVMAARHQMASPLEVQVKSGDSLKVYFKAPGDFSAVALEGASKYIYTGKLHCELLI